jgi:hypothetical protein
MRKSILLTSFVALCATASAASAADLPAAVEIDRPVTYVPTPTAVEIATPVTYYGYDSNGYGYGYRHGYYPRYYRPYGYYGYHHYGYYPHWYRHW